MSIITQSITLKNWD